MKKLVTLLLLLSAIPLQAQDTAITSSGSFGLGASVSRSVNTALASYQLTDLLLLTAQVGFLSTNYADTFGSTTQNYPGTWWDIGAGAYLTLLSYELLVVQAGPSVEFAYDAYQNDGDPSNYRFTYVDVDLSLRVLAMITRNIGAFAIFGPYYAWQDTNNTTLALESSKTMIGLQSLSLGVVFYFK